MKPFLKFLFSLTILFSSISVLNAQQITWQKVLSGLGTFQGGQEGLQAYNGDYMILNFVIGNNGGMYMIDLDQYGNENWVKKVDSTEYSKCIIQTNDSGFIISGEALTKVDRSGNFIWKKSYQNRFHNKIVQIDSNNLLTCGYTSSFIAFIMKTDSAGNIIWQNYIGTDSDALDVIMNSDGYIYLTGGMSLKTMIAKLNNNGEIIWINTYGSGGATDYQEGYAIVPESNRELFISGYYRYSYNGYFAKIDSSGNFIFQRVISQTTSARDMVRTSNGNYAIAGVGWGIISEDFRFLLLNTNGDILLQKSYNSFGEESDYSNSIIETYDKGFLMTGSSTYDPGNSLGSYSTYIIKMDSTGNAPVSVKNLSNEIPSSFELYQNYPNPFNPITKLEFGISKLGFVSLKVYDVLGNEVKTLVNETKTAGNYEVVFDGSNLPSGVYFYKLSINNLTDVKRMVLLK